MMKIIEFTIRFLMEQKPSRFLSEMVLAPSLDLGKSPLQCAEIYCNGIDNSLKQYEIFINSAEITFNGTLPDGTYGSVFSVDNAGNVTCQSLMIADVEVTP